MRLGIWLTPFISIGLLLSACASSSDIFSPRGHYPPDPWVKGYANPNDCLGGEALAARHIPLPDYPKRAWRTGQQGWVIIKLDVNSAGDVENVISERAIPEGIFEHHTERHIEGWKFEPLSRASEENSPTLKNCRILIRYRLGDVFLGS